jgi:hypothetical protein
MLDFLIEENDGYRRREVRRANGKIAALGRPLPLDCGSLLRALGANGGQAFRERGHVVSTGRQQAGWESGSRLPQSKSLLPQ